MQKAVIGSTTYNHLLFLPEDYGPGRSWPVILYLHGIGAKGDYIEMLKAHGLPKYLEGHKDFPFITVSPQCPDDEDWSSDKLDRLLDEFIEDYRIDVDRVYLTGIGEGASAAWRLAGTRPSRFAAFAPVCGGGNPHEACFLRNLPVWIFHGAKDSIFPLTEAQGMVLALRLCGGIVNLTVYPEADHDSWTDTYSNPELYAWLLKQTRSRFTEAALDPVVEDLD